MNLLVGRYLAAGPKGQSLMFGIHVTWSSVRVGGGGHFELGKKPLFLSVRVKMKQAAQRPRVSLVDEFFELLKHSGPNLTERWCCRHNAGPSNHEILLAMVPISISNDRSFSGPKKRGGRRVDDVEDGDSRDDVPLDARSAEVLLQMAPRYGLPKRQDWLFANPFPQEAVPPEERAEVQIKRAAKRAGLGEDIGLHSFRHIYRSWLVRRVLQ